LPSVTDRTHKHKPQLSVEGTMTYYKSWTTAHLFSVTRIKIEANKMPSLGIHLPDLSFPSRSPQSTYLVPLPRLGVLKLSSGSTWTGSMTNFPSSTRHSTEPWALVQLSTTCLECGKLGSCPIVQAAISLSPSSSTL